MGAWQRSVDSDVAYQPRETFDEFGSVGSAVGWGCGDVGKVGQGEGEDREVKDLVENHDASEIRSLS